LTSSRSITVPDPPLTLALSRAAERGRKRFTPVPSSLLPSGERGMDLLLLSPHPGERMKERGHD
jgi:hypothetical protein